MSELKYQPVDHLDRAGIVRNLQSGDPGVVAEALYSASRYDEDTAWVEDVCLKGLLSPDVNVRWAAATCLGDMAFARRALDLTKVIPALEAAANDDKIADPASFSLSMVKQFLLKEESNSMADEQ